MERLHGPRDHRHRCDRHRGGLGAPLRRRGRHGRGRLADGVELPGAGRWHQRRGGQASFVVADLTDAPRCREGCRSGDRTPGPGRRTLQRGRRLRTTLRRWAAAHADPRGLRGDDAPQRHQPRPHERPGPARHAGAGAGCGRAARRHRQHGQRAGHATGAGAVPDPRLCHGQGRHRRADAHQRGLLRQPRHPHQHGGAGADHLAHVRARGGRRGHAGVLAAQAAPGRRLHRRRGCRRGSPLPALARVTRRSPARR